MNLVVISGLSGAGKSVALHTLEDEGYHCIDNLPSPMIDSFGKLLAAGDIGRDARIAMSLDIRNLGAHAPDSFHDAIGRLRARAPRLELRSVYLSASDDALFARFNGLNRTHPMQTGGRTLAEAVRAERALLSGLMKEADLRIDTSTLNQNQFKQLLRERVCRTDARQTVLVQSFSYREGVPLDSDCVFDARCLPNPYWEAALRNLSGAHPKVVEFLDADPFGAALFAQIRDHIIEWAPRFAAAGRAHFTVSVGCTGGQHRSVYLVDRLHAALVEAGFTTLKRHRELA